MKTELRTKSMVAQKTKEPKPKKPFAEDGRIKLEIRFVNQVGVEDRKVIYSYPQYNKNVPLAIDALKKFVVKFIEKNDVYYCALRDNQTANRELLEKWTKKNGWTNEK